MKKAVLGLIAVSFLSIPASAGVIRSGYKASKYVGKKIVYASIASTSKAAYKAGKYSAKAFWKFLY